MRSCTSSSNVEDGAQARTPPYAFTFKENIGTNPRWSRGGSWGAGIGLRRRGGAEGRSVPVGPKGRAPMTRWETSSTPATR